MDFWRGGAYDNDNLTNSFGAIRNRAGNSEHWTNSKLNSTHAHEIDIYIGASGSRVFPQHTTYIARGIRIHCATDRKSEAPADATWHPDVAGTVADARIQVVPVSSRRSDPLPPVATRRAIPDTAERPIVEPTPPKILQSNISFL